MNEEKRKIFAEFLMGVTKKEWEFIREKIDLRFASAANKVILEDDAETITNAITDTWNET